MKVKCVNTGGASLLASDIASGNTRASVFHVIEGQEYTVYGILFFRAVVSYLIRDGSKPSWTPASLFEVTCSRASRLWRFVNWSSEGAYICAFTFPELIQNQEVFDQLALGDESACATFLKLSQLADLEFPDPAVKETAKLLEGHWVLCPFCSEASEAMTPDAMVKCPSCQKVFNNPAYRANEDKKE